VREGIRGGRGRRPRSGTSDQWRRRSGRLGCHAHPVNHERRLRRDGQCRLRHGRRILARLISTRRILTRLISGRLIPGRLILARLISTRRILTRLISGRLIPGRLILARLILARLIPGRLILARLIPGRLISVRGSRVALDHDPFDAVTAEIPLLVDLRPRR
jgi:hypothetical protein